MDMDRREPVAELRGQLEQDVQQHHRIHAAGKPHREATLAQIDLLETRARGGA